MDTLNDIISGLKFGDLDPIEAHNRVLALFSVSGSLQEHKQVIKDLLQTYILDLDDDGNLKADITELMALSDRAVKLIK